MHEPLLQAALTATPIEQLRLPDAETGYAVQAALIQARLDKGESPVGYKMGLTSKAKQAQVNVNETIFGRLTDAMRVADGGSVDIGRFIHPRVEPEVAFLVSQGVLTHVAPAIELIDSRYKDFEFTLPDVVADNTSAAAFVIGPWSPLPLGMDNLGVLLEVDGAVVQVGSTAAILGDPRRAFTALTELAERYGVPLQDGVLLAGAATAAVPLGKGTYVRAVVEGLGTAALRS